MEVVARIQIGETEDKRHLIAFKMAYRGKNYGMHLDMGNVALTPENIDGAIDLMLENMVRLRETLRKQ